MFDRNIRFQDFLTFLIISILVVVFFPWSLLLLVIFFGIGFTKNILSAMFNDGVDIAKLLFTIIIPIVVIIIFIAAISS